jgi:hypothetical protein
MRLLACSRVLPGFRVLSAISLLLSLEFPAGRPSLGVIDCRCSRMNSREKAPRSRPGRAKAFTDDSNDLPALPSAFGQEVATWVTPVSTGAIGDTVTAIDTSFPEGQALADWLVTVGASATRGWLSFTGEGKPMALDHLPPTSKPWLYEPVSVPVWLHRKL